MLASIQAAKEKTIPQPVLQTVAHDAARRATYGLPNATASLFLSEEPSFEVQNVVDTSATQTTHLQIDLSSRQVTLYRGAIAVKTYPIGVGRPGWETPTGTFRVAQLIQRPTWISPFNNEVIPAGDPRNPMGQYWIGFWTNGTSWIGFHGTLNPNTVGRASSHGCIHMLSQDLEELFFQVSLGTQVVVVR